MAISEMVASASAREIFFVLFVAGLAAFLYWDRKKVNRHYILFYRRTKRGIDKIDRIAKSAPRFWNLYGWGAAIVGTLSVVGSLAMIGFVIKEIVSSPTISEGVQKGGLSFVAPGLVSEPQIQAGVSFIPVEYWVIGVGIIMFVHEMSHGIVGRAEGFELNSVGWIVLGILPGAFVEPKGENMLPGDEANQDDSTGMWEGGTWTSRLKVLGAGSFANYLTAAVFFLLLLGTDAAFTTPSDVHYRAQENFSAYESGMRNGSLVQVNGKQIDNLKDLKNVSDSIKVNDTVTVWSSEGNFTFEATEGPDDYNGKGYMGVRIGQARIIKEDFQQFESPLNWFTSLFLIVGYLNFAIGLFNMLPFKPLDGGLMVETFLQRFDEDKIEYLDRFSLIGWVFLLGMIMLGLVL